MVERRISKPNQSLDKALDKRACSRVPLSQRTYEVYLLLIKGFYDQTQVAKKLNISRQAVHIHTKKLSILGLIEPINPNGNPLFYRPTFSIPIVSSKKSSIILSETSKKMERSVGKPPILVRDRASGRIKGWKSARKAGSIRNYNTVVSINGKRITIFRVGNIAYACTILHEPIKKVPWVPAPGMKGMEQFVYRHVFKNKESELFNLRKLEVTFVRQKTKTVDEIIIYMPEKYFLEWELEQGERVLQQYVWTAHRWFQNAFKAYLGMPLKHRNAETAREIFDPRLKRWVHENGMAKIQTKHGYGVVDESKKGIPEREFSSIELVQADMNAGSRVIDLELQMAQVMNQITKLGEVMEKMSEKQMEMMESQRQMMENQKQFTKDVQEFMGFRRKMEKKLERENSDMFS